MITKMFTSEQAMAHLAYAITCGYSYEKFTFGKGVYGNRVSLMRDKEAKNLYSDNATFKSSTFHAVEGIKTLELPQTIIITRKKLESFFTNKENMLEFLENYNTDFVTTEDKEKLADTWYNEVSRKLLVSEIIDFNRLNNFIISNIILHLPIAAQLDIARFRKEQIITLVTQKIFPQEFAKRQLMLMPANKEKLVAQKQKLLMQKIKAQG